LGEACLSQLNNGIKVSLLISYDFVDELRTTGQIVMDGFILT